MNINKINGILKRELKEKLFAKSFILMTLLIPGIIFLSITIQTYVMSSEDTNTQQIIIYSEIPEIVNPLTKEINDDLKEDSQYIVDVRAITSDDFDSELQKIKPLLLDNSITGVIQIPTNAIKDKRIRYYSQNPKNEQIKGKFRGIINQILISNYFSEKNLNDDDINFAKEKVRYDELKVTKETIEESGIGAEILYFIFIFLLYMSLIFSGQLVLRSVVEEKSNRIVEVLLSSVSSNDLIIGKIIGASITSLAQMFIWMIPIILALSSTWFLIPDDFRVSISVWQWLYYFANFFIGLITFMGLFAAVGSIFDNDQDAQSGMWPLLMLIMIPFFIALSVRVNPNSAISVTTSLIPFASIMVMPARMTLVDVPLYQFILSLLVNLGTLILIFPIAGKIYRIGVLRTGKKPSLKELLTWIKMKNI